MSGWHPRGPGRTRALLALPLLVAPWGCDGGEPGAPPEPPRSTRVEVSRVVPAPSIVGHPAEAIAARRVELATRLSGTVRRVHVDVGDGVVRDQPLVELDGADVEARIEEAEAAVEQALARFGRIRRLEADGAATAQELDDARAALAMAEGRLRAARAQRAYVVLRAPYRATVAWRRVEPGDLAVPGRPVLGLVSPGRLEVVAALSAPAAAGLRPGRSLRAVEPTSGTVYRVRVARIAPSRDPVDRRVRVELEVEVEVEDSAVGTEGAGSRERLLPGSYLRLELPAPGSASLWMPEDALLRRGQLAGAFVVTGDRLSLRWVRPGPRREGAVEVLSGLEAGEAVVRRPGPSLVDGIPVSTADTLPWEPFGASSVPAAPSRP